MANPVTTPMGDYYKTTKFMVAYLPIIHIDTSWDSDGDGSGTDATQPPSCPDPGNGLCDWIGVYDTPSSDPATWTLTGARMWDTSVCINNVCEIMIYGRDGFIDESKHWPEGAHMSWGAPFYHYNHVTGEINNLNHTIDAIYIISGVTWDQNFRRGRVIRIGELHYDMGEPPPPPPPPPGGGCFVADTMVSTPNGEIPIQNLKAGDLVNSFMNSNDQLTTSTINALVSHNPDEDNYGLYELKTENHTVTVTGNHPFVLEDVNGPSWVSPVNLLVNDKIYVESGKLETIISLEKLEYKEDTFNLMINDTHTYIADGFRVHNAYGPIRSGKQRRNLNNRDIKGNNRPIRQKYIPSPKRRGGRLTPFKRNIKRNIKR